MVSVLAFITTILPSCSQTTMSDYTKEEQQHAAIINNMAASANDVRERVVALTSAAGSDREEAQMVEDVSRLPRTNRRNPRTPGHRRSSTVVFAPTCPPLTDVREILQEDPPQGEQDRSQPVESQPKEGPSPAVRRELDNYHRSLVEAGYSPVAGTRLFANFRANVMANNANSFPSVESPMNNRVAASPVGSQANGAAMNNPANYMAPLPVGHQHDLNYLYAQIQELSGILKDNRERVNDITKTAEEVAVCT